MKKLTLLRMPFLLLLAAIFCATGVFAWLATGRRLDFTKSGGSVLTQYFHCGTGTEDDPYVITRPIHYENLVKLYQVNPEFGSTDFITSSLYFRIGTMDPDNDGVNEWDTLSVFNYDDDGELIDEEPCTELNLKGCGPLLPVGSARKPFEAVLDGSGLKLKNLTVTGSQTIEAHGLSLTYTTPDVGIFGYLSETASVSNLYVENFTISLVGADGTAQTSDTDIEHIQHQSVTGTDGNGDPIYADSDVSYVGYIAGHVVVGASVQDVYVNDCTILGGAAAECGYGYFGHVEDGNGTAAATLGSMVATQRRQGDNAGFGGSIDMQNIYNRLNGMFTSPAATVRNVTSETILFDEVTGETTQLSVTRANSNASADGNTVYYYANDAAGSYYMFRRSGSGWSAIYLYGENSRQNTKTVSQYTILKDPTTKTYQVLEGIKIYDGDAYLSRNSANAIVNAAEADAAVWFFDGSGHLYTRNVWMTDDGGHDYVLEGDTKYYLNATTQGLSISTSASTVWTRNDEANTLTFTAGGQTYYLIYDAGWTVTGYAYRQYLHDGAGNYLSAGGTAVANAGSKEESRHWYMTSETGSTSLMTKVNGTEYYLYPENGALALRTGTAFTWARDEAGLYADFSGTKYYILYENGWVLRPTSGYRITDGAGHWLNTAGDTVSGLTDASTVWQLSAPTGTETAIYTCEDGTRRYLAGDGTLGLSTSEAVWQQEIDEASGARRSLYRMVDGARYTLTYDNGWKMEWHMDNNSISDGAGSYLIHSAGTVDVSTDAAGSTWAFTDPAQTDGSVTQIFYGENGTNHYLSASAGVLTVSDSACDWTYDAEHGTYYVELSGVKLYLTLADGSWRLSPAGGVYLKTGEGEDVRYLGADGNGVNETQTLWLRDDVGHIFTLADGNVLYLRWNGGLTADGDSTNAVWTIDNGEYFCTVAGIRFYLVYDGGWQLSEREYAVISDGAGNYLRVTGENSFANADAAGATHFYVSDLSGTDPAGTAACAVNGSITYLRNNGGTLETTSDAAAATSWLNDGASLYVENGNVVYALCYDGSWNVRTIVLGIPITDGNGNYLKVIGTGSGASAFANTTNEQEATRFIFSVTGTNPSGLISTLVNGTTVYLRNNAGILQTTTSAGNATQWTNDGNTIRQGTGASSYHIVYNNGWSLAQGASASKTMYMISQNGTYLCVNENGSITSTTTAANATLWSGTSGVISATVGGNTYYLTYSGTTLQTTTDSGSATSWTNSNNRLYYTTSTSFIITFTTYHYIRYQGNSWGLGETRNQNSMTTLTVTQTAVSLYSHAENVDTTRPVIRVDSVQKTPARISDETASAATVSPIITAPNSYTPPTVLANSYTAAVNTRVISEPEKITVSASPFEMRLGRQEADKTNQPTGYPTYFPIRVPGSEDDDYEAGNLLKASLKNTGYIVAGGNFYNGNSSGTTVGDIRVSSYSISNISSSYSTSSRTFTNVRTVNGSGEHQLTNAEKTENYTVAAEQFAETLGGSSNVFGLHFMNSEISTNNITYADQVTVLGKTYRHYELPEDSIDFKVVERGSISFFAGTYFTGNNSFFSLHQIFRDEDQKITDIKEIKTVYQTSRGILDRYVYEFMDGTFYNGREWFSTVPEGYTAAFQTDWITYPSGVTDNRLYFFEIPCNDGEYALGSVSGRTGAYLVYLDIASNGGDMLNKVISGEGNAVTQIFRVDYRDWPEFVPADRNSVLQFAITAPAGSNESDFTVHVEFDDSTGTCAGTDYTKGLYTITVTNHTGQDLQLDVFLCDDDDDLSNDFLYAYRVKYVNNTHTTAGVILNQADFDYHQSMNSFTIPSSGDAETITYA